MKQQRYDKKRTGKKRIAAACILACALTAVLAQPGFANDLGDIWGESSVTVEVPADSFEGIEKANVVLDYYQIAKAEPLSSGYDSFEFQWKDTYGEQKADWMETVEKAQEEERDLTAAEIDALAQALAGAILADVPEYESGAAGTLPTPDFTGELDKPVENIEEGLYLIVPHGSDLSDYKIVTDGVISMIAVGNKKEFHFAPILVSVPQREEVTEFEDEGTIEGNEDWTYSMFLGNTGNSGDWVGDLTIQLKAGSLDTVGSLKIVKNLVDFETFEGRVDPATFIFDIEGKLNGERVISTVETMVFTEAGDQSVVIENIPVGTVVKIKETYSCGKKYVADEPLQEVTIVSDEETEITTVEFTNHYDGPTPGGGSVLNHFEADGNGGWDDENSTKTENDNEGTRTDNLWEPAEETK